MFELTVPARHECFNDVMEFIISHMCEAGLDTRQQNNVAIVVEEIFINIASYAYPKDGGDVTIRFSLNPDKIVFEFIDSGKPYDPLSKDDPDTTLSVEDREIGGLGIYMVKKIMDNEQYRYENNQNVLYMEKSIN